MKRLLSILLLSSIWFSSLGQIPDKWITRAVPLTGTYKNNESSHWANMTIDGAFRVPNFSTNTLRGAKDSVGYIGYNTSLQKLMVYKGGGVWEALAEQSGSTYTAGYGLALTGTQFRVDSTLIATKGFLGNNYFNKSQSDARFAPITGGSGYIWNQSSTSQTASSWISGVSKAGGFETSKFAIDDGNGFRTFGLEWSNYNPLGTLRHAITEQSDGTLTIKNGAQQNTSSFAQDGTFTAYKLSINQTPSTDATPTQLLSLDAGTGEVNKVAYSSIGTATVVNNTAWVDINGSDAIGTVGRQDKPFLTIDAALDALPAGGNSVINIGIGSFNSPTNAKIKSNTAFIGAKEPVTNSTITFATPTSRPTISAPTQLVDGTILLGLFRAADKYNIRVENLGVDVGKTWTDAFNGGVPVSGLTITATSGAPVKNITVNDVIALGYSPTTAEHALIFQNVADSHFTNLTTYYHTHGMVIKGTNVTLTGLNAFSHSGDGLIIKSDTYAPTKSVAVSNVNISSLSGYDGAGIILEEGTFNTVPLEGIDISNVNMRYVKYGLVNVNKVTNVNVTNMNIYDSNTFGVRFDTNSDKINLSGVNVNTTGTQGIEISINGTSSANVVSSNVTSATGLGYKLTTAGTASINLVNSNSLSTTNSYEIVGTGVYGNSNFGTGTYSGVIKFKSGLINDDGTTVNIANSLTINGSILDFKASGVADSRIRSNGSGSLLLSSTGTQKTIYLRPDGDVSTVNQLALTTTDLTVGGSRIWTAANDGTGTGLDADLLDGLHASSFVTTTTTQTGLTGAKTWTGLHNFDNGQINVTNSSGTSIVKIDNGISTLGEGRSQVQMFASSSPAKPNFKNFSLVNANAASAGGMNSFVISGRNDNATGRANLMSMLSDGKVQFGASTPLARFQIADDASVGAWGNIGSRIRVTAAIYTDTASAAATVIPIGAADVFSQATFASRNAITITDAVGTRFFSPIAGTNVTITNNRVVDFDGNTYTNGHEGIGIKPISTVTSLLSPLSDANKGYVSRAFSPTQSANLFEAQTSTSVVVWSVSPTGVINSASTTASRALVTDASKNVVSSATTATEIGYVSGVTSSIQTQLDSKGTKARITASGTGIATTITYAHGLSGVTSSSWVSATANNAASAGISYVTVDATNVSIIYTVAPAAGTNNLIYSVEVKP